MCHFILALPELPNLSDFISLFLLDSLNELDHSQPLEADLIIYRFYLKSTE
jgi:hypothetical protein